jgi:hypothetical protein
MVEIGYEAKRDIGDIQPFEIGMLIDPEFAVENLLQAKSLYEVLPRILDLI